MGDAVLLALIIDWPDVFAINSRSRILNLLSTEFKNEKHHGGHA